MLGKLLKHEWRETWKIPALVNGLQVLLAVVLCLVLACTEFEAAPGGVNLGAFLIFMLGMLGMACISFLVTVYFAVRFYRNLFTDEGYLMHTLPVSADGLLLSKLLIAAFWTLVTGLVTLIFMVPLLEYGISAMSGAAVMINGEAATWKELLALLEESGMNMGDILLSVLITLPVGALSGILMIYASVCLGQLFLKHRVLGAVAAYIGLYSLMQIAAAIVLLPAMSSLVLAEMNGEMYLTAWNSLMKSSVLLSSLLALVFGVLGYLASRYVIGKCLNLE